MMATVLRKVKLGNKNKSENITQNGVWDAEDKDDRRRVNASGETFVQCGRVCGLVKVCTGPADSMGSRRRRNRPRGRGNVDSHLTLFQSLQLRIDLWTSTTGHLLDRSFTRRFCHRKSDNELYRSNSFRFEKFDKEEEDLTRQLVFVESNNQERELRDGLSFSKNGDDSKGRRRHARPIGNLFAMATSMDKVIVLLKTVTTFTVYTVLVLETIPLKITDAMVRTMMKNQSQEEGLIWLMVGVIKTIELVFIFAITGIALLMFVADYIQKLTKSNLNTQSLSFSGNRSPDGDNKYMTAV